MAYYCSFNDVQGLLPKVDFTSPASKPSQEDVDRYIRFCDARIRGLLEAEGYNTNPTDLYAVEYLKGVCALGAAAMAERANFPGARSGEGWNVLWSMYTEELKHIQDKEAPGLSPSSTSAQALPESLYTVDPSAVPEGIFHIGSEQW